MQWFATYCSHYIVKEVFDKLELYDKPRGEASQDVEQELNVIGVVSVRQRCNNISEYSYKA